MGGQTEGKKITKRICAGLLAHVDAGKTTLAEAMLYMGGSIRKTGRVDNQDAFLDTHILEKERGITIFSKQAEILLGDMEVTLLDTPGHVDFSAEMERSLQVLDYAVLVISGADGVQGHTQTLWRLLAKYKIPVFLFINKMDQEGTDRTALLYELQNRLSDGCLDFGTEKKDTLQESIAMCGEEALACYLENGMVGEEEIRRLVRDRKLFPCFFGSALKLEGVEALMDGIRANVLCRSYPEAFGARIYKIARDEQENRLTYMKITGGCLKVKATLTNREKSWEDKVNQIRIYSGEKYETVKEAPAGCICAVTGLTRSRAGEGLGKEPEALLPVLTPVLNYRIILPADCDPAVMLPKLRLLEEEDPALHITWMESQKEIHAQLMGEVQTEILQSLIRERFHIDVEFGEGNIVYRETIADCVEGVGHYEPLRHYAEVHLLLEPGERGSGLKFAVSCSEDVLGRNWQRLVLTHLEEKEHKGVLTGAAITDMKITLIAGRAHQKHTEGGDFRQATYRALRQGLMEAQSVLLEPYYEFRLEVPEKTVGKAMTDMEKAGGSFDAPRMEDGMAVLTGSVPAATVQGYQKEVISYTGGHGKLFLTWEGYGPCHNTEEVLEKTDYDPERDLENPTGSVFCSHGAGCVVDWKRVKEYMHVESAFVSENKEKQEYGGGRIRQECSAATLGTEEVDAILERTFGANRRPFAKQRPVTVKRQEQQPARVVAAPRITQEEYLLVDGYNILFAWEELKELAKVSLDGARGRLIDLMCNYQAVRKCNLIVVFDAYRVQGHDTEYMDFHNIHVVYTKESETADQFIEKFAHQNGKKYSVTVATSDGLEQIIIRGQGCMLLSARELEEEMKRTVKLLQEEYERKQPVQKNYLPDGLSEETRKQMDKIRQESPKGKE